ncbi:methylated-DNA--[protein]-cysteine S-methyltransferase [Ferrimicrobium sp.]|uniref:methylated-DNA--[protein]-cysteine S-methyltransferase n=1 Tax=Ferrimicrobium sp. TaxID=2926050 RepID=UPI002615E077|nr:methylated-DNA--[protein]-cysteine S-methyltransferase [Ferrimicrobium sp.]
MTCSSSKSDATDYDRVAEAITFITDRVCEQPTLEEVADHLNLSPYHFQRIFSRWAGVSPKKYLQVLTLEQAKQLLSDSKSVLETSNILGLSSSSRLYDHFVHMEAVTPGEYKAQGTGLTIEFGVHNTPFGNAFIATTPRGVCNIAFSESKDISELMEDLRQRWPHAVLHESQHSTQKVVAAMFRQTNDSKSSLSLYVSGTNFQINVWKALLRIPPGSVASYAQIANFIGQPGSARAIGHAVGANPIAYLIPCHRVIQANGGLGGYHWGTTRKQVMLAWEHARLQMA